MKYLGGKITIGKRLTTFIEEDTQYETYFEPFCGVCGVGRHMNMDMILNDIHPDLILLLTALYKGEFTFPETITEEEYNFLKNQPPSALRAFYGFLLSWGGRWFAGYSPKYGKRDFLGEAIRACKKLQKKFSNKSILFENKDYMDFSPIGMCVYVDPPYMNKTGYHVEFDHEIFWNKMRFWSICNDVYISSYEAPADFQCIYEVDKRVTLSKNQETRYERLFKLRI
jgi:DNA adenine methylase